jgi:TonB-dependent SusC/RagA subfamily outer membrane receptor
MGGGPRDHVCYSMVSLRVLLPAGVLMGLLAGCARSTGTGQEQVRDAPEEGPPSGVAVTAEDIERAPGQSIEEVLMSRFPGVRVERARDGGLIVRIRGRTSIRGSNEPLYVIDGVPIEAEPGGSLQGINPYDIESIEVVTDPTGTAMYGVRGANGVIVIKTKRPDQ